MIRARELFDYFLDFHRKPYPDILQSIESTNAFGISFAAHSSSMQKTLEDIQAQVEQDRNDKIQEVSNAKSRYELLMKKASSLNCECNVDLYFRKCDRCTTIQQANNIKVHIYECPIPSKRDSALAVVFELQMPTEFRSDGDIVWMFINRLNPEPPSCLIEWLSVAPHSTKLSRFYNGPYKRRVKLVSSNKSITQSHYSAPRQVASTPLEEFLYENSLQVQISPTKPAKFHDECQLLTPHLIDPNYKHLQFSINSTQFVHNQVIAELSNCSLRLKPAQFVDFGSFRSGHCLQWWNLYRQKSEE